MKQFVEGYTNSELRKLKGVYCFTFPNGRRYVGITYGCGNFGNRFSNHLKDVRNNSPYAVHRAIKKFGWDKVKREIILVTEDEERCKNLEKQLIAFWKLNIKRFGTASRGYNMTDGGEGNSGPTGKPSWNKGRKNCFSHTEENKKNISIKMKEYMNDPEVKKKYKELATGRVLSEEARKIIGVSKIGNKWNVGRKHTEETKRNMSEAKMGHEVTQEMKNKISETKKRKGDSVGSKNPQAIIRAFKNIKTGEIKVGPMKTVGDELGFNGKTFSAMIHRNKIYKDWIWLQNA